MNTRATQRRGAKEAGSVGDNEKPGLLNRPPIRKSQRSKGTEGSDDGNKTKNIQDKVLAGLGDSTKIKTSFSERVASKESPSDSRRKANNLKKSVAVDEGIKEEDSNDSDKESDYEEHSSEDELEFAGQTSPNIQKLLAKGDGTKRTDAGIRRITLPGTLQEGHCGSAGQGYIEEGGNQNRLPPSLRPRKDVKSHPVNIKTNRNYDYFGEKKESIFRQQSQKTAIQRELLQDTKKFEAYSDVEEDQRKPQAVRGADNQSKPQPVRGNFWIPFLALLVISLGVWMLVLNKPSTTNSEKELQVMKAFQDGFRKLPIIFSGQSPDLWHRSQRMLELQLRHKNENKEPAIILLTAAQDAEQMLYCVGNHLAKTYASTLNSSYTVLSGLDMSSEDSDGVKMDIDQRLSAGFQANNKAAVLHRLELLPPGSLIILYKYCDHENAAFKNVALVITVLLKNSTLQPDIELNALEEKVYDFLKETFLNQAKSRTSHNEMDGDKLGGVWSRISHIVLPVFPGKQIVKDCGESNVTP
ncbi:unnamed protein product [Staurois parvus]|uniref:Torsin-1A-interacting protein 1/2 AAA+ activator domain-containing protein n=1 Tax=Staurois parvus TaxID=386267 RepID=A0ABN9D7R2_9NEOB|nr:unnamed protein product [Staurois parvus]